MIGKTLNDRYKIIEQIGRGGMAYVYKARDLKLNRDVAVKILREEYVENEQFIKKFNRESQSAASLSHPNIVSIYDVGVQDDDYYIIMEYVDGMTLKQYLNKKGRLDYVEATQFILEIAQALKCAHDHQIIHRDIKPHNILLTQDLVPKVADFGIARAVTSSTVTMTNQTMGSVHYISPEQARGGFVDNSSDLYSLGVMYYELITGELPFDAETSVSIAIKHIQEPIIPPKNLVNEIPDSVNEVILKLTQKRQEDRYQDAEELINDLDLMLDDFEAVLPSTELQTGPLEEVTGNIFLLEDNYPEFDTTALDEKNTKKKNLGIWIAIGIIILLFLLGIGIYAANSALTQTVIVPDLTNVQVDQAITELQNIGLKAEVEREAYSADIPEGNIISQTPTSGSSVREGSTVKLTVSQGIQMINLEDVVGMSEEEANSVLTNQGFVVEIQREFNSDYRSGIVYQTDPEPGADLVSGDTVTIYVSRGEDTVSVPGLIGLTQSDAINRLQANGLNIGTVSQQSSSSYAAGVVVSQSPVESTVVQRGTYVNLTISTGPPSSTVTVPDTENSNNSNNNSSNNNSNNNSDNNSNNSETDNNNNSSSDTTTDTTEQNPNNYQNNENSNTYNTTR